MHKNKKKSRAVDVNEELKLLSNPKKGGGGGGGGGVGGPFGGSLVKVMVNEKVIVEMQKKKVNGVLLRGVVRVGGESSGPVGDQSGCERRIEFIVKMQKAGGPVRGWRGKGGSE